MSATAALERPAGRCDRAGHGGRRPWWVWRFTVWLGLWITPPDKVQGNLVRLVYLHPPIAWVALYLAFGMAVLGSLLWLWKRTRNAAWDRLAGASMEVGVVFTALTLVTGSIWGRPTWGVWWAWDARLTSTAMLLVLQLGYLALRRVPSDPEARARRCAVAAVIAAVDVPIVHFSVRGGTRCTREPPCSTPTCHRRSTGRWPGPCSSASSPSRSSSPGW